MESCAPTRRLFTLMLWTAVTVSSSLRWMMLKITSSFVFNFILPTSSIVFFVNNSEDSFVCSPVSNDKMAAAAAAVIRKTLTDSLPNAAISTGDKR